MCSFFASQDISENTHPITLFLTRLLDPKPLTIIWSLMNRLCRYFYKQYSTFYIFQITLLNPVCVIIYTLASWTFFRERVYAEELTLLTFFGPQYVEYQKKVGTGLPYIMGYIPENTGQNVKDDHWSY